MKPMIYLDNSATTKIREQVVEAMQPYLTDSWGNPSSIHQLGRKSRSAVETARQQVADLIGATSEEIFFTPCATYSNNAAILGRAQIVEERGWGRHIITTGIEHSSGLGPVKQLQARGWRVTILGVDKDGIIDLEELKRAVEYDTSIISVMWANNEIGSVQPIEEIANLARARGIFFHTDAVQAAGRLPIDLKKIQADTLSLSGHKFYGPKGIGVLYIRKDTEVKPLIFGGGQEQGVCPGTENLANIVGIGAAAALIVDEIESNRQHLRHLQQVIFDKLTRNLPVKITGPLSLEKRLPGHCSFVIDSIVGGELVELADEQGIFVSSVSACSSGGTDPSHVLKCLGLEPNEALGALRVTAGVLNTEAECAAAVDVLRNLIAENLPSNVCSISQTSYVTSLAV